MWVLVLLASACVIAPLFAGPAPRQAQTGGVGAQITFNHDIAPIMFQSCATCHRPGEAAPFSLLTYSDVKKHAHQIVDVTKSRAMPPWLPEPQELKFADEMRLSDAEINLIERWVEQGEVEGNTADLPRAAEIRRGLASRKARHDSDGGEAARASSAGH